MNAIAQILDSSVVTTEADVQITVVQDVELLYVGGGTGGAVLF